MFGLAECFHAVREDCGLTPRGTPEGRSATGAVFGSTPAEATPDIRPGSETADCGASSTASSSSSGMAANEGFASSSDSSSDVLEVLSCDPFDLSLLNEFFETDEVGVSPG